MELISTVTVDAPVARTWAAVTDLPRVASCLPGATSAGIPVTVGWIAARFEGTARLVERDDDAHRAVLRAEGRDAAGQGDAVATLTVALRPQGHGTQITVDTDLALTGRLAGLGHGVIAGGVARLVARFAQRLEAELRAAPVPAASPAAAATPEPAAPIVPAPSGAVLQRAVPVIGALTALLIGWRFARRTVPASRGPA
ncbi:SRPBCC family protein [Pseudonocardia sp. H11422]|uniref:SRPBCC family protein n=1 Tax=Pseudonocardia sp. H11422 TaxID=2835866 RepID=UPI001BDBC132|nr:SRPBCC family protein [Pseudonocardia sp. H11422]